MSLGNFACVLDSFPAAYGYTGINTGVDNCPALSPNASTTATVSGGGMSGTCTILPLTVTSPGGSYDNVPVAFMIIIPNFTASTANSLSNVINFNSSFAPRAYFISFPDQNNPPALGASILPVISLSSPDIVNGFEISNVGTATSATYIAFLCFGV
jgi:hypothetical protein